jgi:hypothetical protein
MTAPEVDERRRSGAVNGANFARPTLSPAGQRWVDEQIAKAPPLSVGQRERICSLLARPQPG